jgi:ubiquinone/menaquinone biosynthesis C-methylase UbiE
MATERSGDLWAAGDAYEPYVGRWSRAVAHEFLHWLNLPPGLAWLDIGCGTGALSRAILDDVAPGSVIAVDSSAGFLDYARQCIPDPRITFQLGDAQALPLPDHSVDAAVSGLVLNFVPDKARSVAELKRVVRPGGTVALYVWDYADKMELIRYFWDAASAIDPKSGPLDEALRFPICHPEPLMKLFRDSGFADIDVLAIDVPTVFRDFDDYWLPFLGGQGPAPGYCMNLSPDQREALRVWLRDSLPIRADGSIALIARAFAIRATVPRA